MLNSIWDGFVNFNYLEINAQGNDAPPPIISNAPPGSAAPQQMPETPEPMQMPDFPQKKGLPITIIGGAAVLIILLIAGYFVLFGKPGGITGGATTAQGSTSVATTPYDLSTCTTISSPGVYYLVSDINTGIQNSTCILITSSNVQLKGNGHSITGNGPFLTKRPYSYGISMVGVSNDKIDSLTISKFSYGVYLNNSNADTVSNVTAKNITISGIYLLGSKSNLLLNNKISSVNGNGGAVNIQNGGNNTVKGSTIQYNAYYGIVLNSTGNGVQNDTILGNPVDLYCSSSAGYVSYNKFGNTTCYVNNYCNFAECSEINLQTDPKTVVLQPAINSCGSINYPGTYTLSFDLNVANFINLKASNSLIPCITVNASNVYLNCNGHSINNGPYAIFARNTFNTTISNCNLNNNIYGIYLLNGLKFALRNITANGGTYGVYSKGSTAGNVTNIQTYHNKYGIYLNGTTYTSLSRFNSSLNTYGISLDNGSSISLVAGTSLSNTKTDFYCAVNVYNSTLSTVSDSNCRSTDCTWAFNSCPIHLSPGLNTFPVSSCTTITRPGQYQLNTNLIANGDCFHITASNVSLQCSNHTINGVNFGTAFTVTNGTNDAFFACKLLGFGTGVSARKTSYFVMQNIWMNNENYGANITDSQSSIISNVSVYNYSGYGFNLLRTTKSVITQDTAQRGGVSTGIGFLINSSKNNTIINNTALNNVGNGFSFYHSTSNFVKNNTASTNTGQDFICTPDSSGFFTNSGNINSGLTKGSCRWIAEIAPPLLAPICTIITSPNQVSIQYDLIYPYSNNCFTIVSKNATYNARNSVINCNGHVMFATHGGTFVRVINTSYVTIENCVLYGFTTAIAVTSKYPQQNVVLMNDTIINSSTGIYALNVQQFSTINNNNITIATNGIIDAFGNFSTINNNLLTATTNGILITNSTGVNFLNNQITSSNRALSIYNTTQMTVRNNTLTGTKMGLYCSPNSAPKSTASVDNGQNVCTSTNCAWAPATC